MQELRIQTNVTNKNLEMSLSIEDPDILTGIASSLNPKKLNVNKYNICKKNIKWVKMLNINK